MDRVTTSAPIAGNVHTVMDRLNFLAKHAMEKENIVTRTREIWGTLIIW